MIRTITKLELGWARAALGAIYPRAACPKLPLGICDLDVDAFLRDLLRRVPLVAAFGLRVAIWIVGLAPLFVLHRLRTIVALGPSEREALLARLLASPVYAVRQLVAALKATGGLLYAGAPEVRARIFPPLRPSPVFIALRRVAAAPEVFP